MTTITLPLADAERVRADFLARIDKCHSMIVAMCKEGRPPKMEIPAKHDENNEDIFICDTLNMMKAILTSAIATPVVGGDEEWPTSIVTSESWKAEERRKNQEATEAVEHIIRASVASNESAAPANSSQDEAIRLAVEALENIDSVRLVNFDLNANAAYDKIKNIADEALAALKSSATEQKPSGMKEDRSIENLAEKTANSVIGKAFKARKENTDNLDAFLSCNQSIKDEIYDAIRATAGNTGDYVLVPREPTHDMIKEGVIEALGTRWKSRDWPDYVKAIYVKMLAATSSPDNTKQPPTGGE